MWGERERVNVERNYRLEEDERKKDKKRERNLIWKYEIKGVKKWENGKEATKGKWCRDKVR